MSAFRLIAFCVISIAVNVQCANRIDFAYHNFTSLKEILNSFANVNRSDINRKVYSIGNSTQGRELLVFQITATPKKLGVPNVKLIGGMFGNQPAGTEILLHFIDYLITSYGADRNVTYLLNNTILHILPLMNPDGNAYNQEGNYNKILLYKTFPDIYRKNGVPIQPETKAILEWMKHNFFVLSASLNGKGKMVIYPYTTRENFMVSNKEPSLTADDDVFRYLSKVYSYNHLTMLNTSELGCTPVISNLPDGIVNGGKLQRQDGIMQDYNYFKHGCMELDIRVSCLHKPKDDFLPQLWNENKKALVEYCLQANQGVYGTVKDSTGNPVESTFKIIGREMNFTTNKQGEFWKILLNGAYEIEVTANGFHKKRETFEIDSVEGFPKLKHLEILLINSSVSTTTKAPVETKTASVNYYRDNTEPIKPFADLVRSCARTHTFLRYLLLLNFSVVLLFKT